MSGEAAKPDASGGTVDLSGNRSTREDLMDSITRWVFFACALVTILTTIGIFAVLFFGSYGFFSDVSVVDYLTGTNWNPVGPEGLQSFGVLPLVWGTIVVTVTSAVVAIPIGTATAIYLAEYADPSVRKTLKPTLEILAGIPTIVYGFFALSFMTPVIQTIFPATGTFNALSAGIVVGIMIIPMVSSLSEDAMSAVPDDLRNAAYGLGATKFDVSTSVVVPAALSGIIASYILALSRAIGETMIVALAMGNRPQITMNLLDEMQPMTGFMVDIAISDASAGSIGYQSLFAVGLTLFAMTLSLNLFSLWIKSRYREEYQ